MAVVIEAEDCSDGERLSSTCLFTSAIHGSLWWPLPPRFVATTTISERVLRLQGRRITWNSCFCQEHNVKVIGARKSGSAPLSSSLKVLIAIALILGQNTTYQLSARCCACKAVYFTLNARRIVQYLAWRYCTRIVDVDLLEARLCAVGHSSLARCARSRSLSQLFFRHGAG